MRFEKVAKADDVHSDDALQVKVGDHVIALLRVDDEIHAVSDICTHELAYLSEGFVEGPHLECPLHGSQFDVRTGEVKSLPATRDLRRFPIRVEGGDVLVGIEDDEGS